VPHPNVVLFDVRVGFHSRLKLGPLTDGNYSYTWNAESQMKTAAGLTYNYDGDGRRVAKAGSKLYWYGSGGEILAETDTSGNTQNEYIFFGGKRVALVPASGSVLYYAEDMLGSSRVIVQSNGTLCYDADFTPFGAERAYTSTCPQNYKFEGKERDSETQNDEFGARSYSWRFGRWLSSDWSSVPVPVPYANLTNPQTLNLYAMVADDPESFADLDGHEDKDSNATPPAGPTADKTLAQNTQAETTAQNTTAAAATLPLVLPQPSAPPLDLGKVVDTVVDAVVDAVTSTTVAVAATAAYLISPGSGGGNNQNDTIQYKGGPKAADAPGVTAGGQATNGHGQKIAPSGKPQVNEVNRNTREGAKNAANRGSGTIHDQNPKDGDRSHFHPARGDGSKVRDGSHYYYPE
jgi:RHS repeat-associated protein